MGAGEGPAWLCRTFWAAQDCGGVLSNVANATLPAVRRDSHVRASFALGSDAGPETVALPPEGVHSRPTADSWLISSLCISRFPVPRSMNEWAS
jgi:hypothetical protein